MFAKNETRFEKNCRDSIIGENNLMRKLALDYKIRAKVLLYLTARFEVGKQLLSWSGLI